MENLQQKIQLTLNLFKLKRFTEAESALKNIIKSYPNNSYLCNLLGLILINQNKFEEAKECYENGINIDPNYAAFYDNLGTLYRITGDYKVSEKYYIKSIKLDKKKPEPHNNLGNLYKLINENKKAIKCYKNSIKLNSKVALTHFNLALIYKSSGDFEKAKEHLKLSIKINKNFFSAHRALSELIKYDKNNIHYTTLKSIYFNKKIDQNNKTELIFALAKATEDCKDFSNSFKYYMEANNLRRKEVKFSLNYEKDLFNDIKKIFNIGFFNKFKKSGFKDSTSIFILGMPRSGTTLIEQIISSHPKVYGGDELRFLPNIVNKNFCDTNNLLKLNKITQLNEIDLIRLGKEYIANIKSITTKKGKITDKLPINFKWIGLIKLILPNSKIIHVTRDPKDNCLSIFKNYFVNHQLNFAYDLYELCEFYKIYSDLMEYWKKTIPNFIIDVKYENIVSNTNSEIKNLIKKCGLNWDNKCIKYYKNQRLIKTASDTQARKKIYKTSVNNWKKYENFTKKFFAEI